MRKPVKSIWQIFYTARTFKQMKSPEKRTKAAKERERERALSQRQRDRAERGERKKSERQASAKQHRPNAFQLDSSSSTQLQPVIQ